MGFYIKRTNMTDENAVMIIGKRGICGRKAEPYDTVKSALTAMKRQEKQDMMLCPECVINYEIVKENY